MADLKKDAHISESIFLTQIGCFSTLLQSLNGVSKWKPHSAATSTPSYCNKKKITFEWVSPCERFLIGFSVVLSGIVVCACSSQWGAFLKLCFFFLWSDTSCHPDDCGHTMTYCWWGGSLPDGVGDWDLQLVDRALTTRQERTAQTTAEEEGVPGGGVGSTSLGKVLHHCMAAPQFDKWPSITGETIKMLKFYVDVR